MIPGFVDSLNISDVYQVNSEDGIILIFLKSMDFITLWEFGKMKKTANGIRIL